MRGLQQYVTYLRSALQTCETSNDQTNVARFQFAVQVLQFERYVQSLESNLLTAAFLECVRWSSCEASRLCCGICSRRYGLGMVLTCCVSPVSLVPISCVSAVATSNAVQHATAAPATSHRRRDERGARERRLRHDAPGILADELRPTTDAAADGACTRQLAGSASAMGSSGPDGCWSRRAYSPIARRHGSGWHGVPSRRVWSARRTWLPTETLTVPSAAASHEGIRHRCTAAGLSTGSFSTW